MHHELREFSRWPVTIHGQTASVTGGLDKHSSKKPKKQLCSEDHYLSLLSVGLFFTFV